MTALRRHDCSAEGPSRSDGSQMSELGKLAPTFAKIAANAAVAAQDADVARKQVLVVEHGLVKIFEAYNPGTVKGPMFLGANPSRGDFEEWHLRFGRYKGRLGIAVVGVDVRTKGETFKNWLSDVSLNTLDRGIDALPVLVEEIARICDEQIARNHAMATKAAAIAAEVTAALPDTSAGGGGA